MRKREDRYLKGKKAFKTITRGKKSLSSYSYRSRILLLEFLFRATLEEPDVYPKGTEPILFDAVGVSLCKNFE